MFGSQTRPDVTAEIAKLEAQRTAATPDERRVIDRSIAIMRATDVADREPDPTKARLQRIAIARDTLALLDDMAKLEPDDVDTISKVCGSLQLLAMTIESLEIQGELPPRSVLERARSLAKHLVEKHPSSAQAWGLHASVTSQDDPETRLRGFAKCATLEPSNASCKQSLDSERAAYVLPYCEGSEIKGDISWRVASKKPTPGSTPVEHHYETFYLAGSPKFSIEDVVHVQATTTREDAHQADGKVTTRWRSGVQFGMKPATRDAMIAWSRELEKRGDYRATMRGTTLLFTDQRALFEDSKPGISGIEIAELCIKTKMRTLPADL
ncbi:MAG: hypothetical protein H0V17_07175 [Deltaproteobacteria bacterium]|nr:hypothetical protein [Deltaproteobacteria bacterium]